MFRSSAPIVPKKTNEDPPWYIIGENQLNYYLVGEMIGTTLAGTPVYAALLHPFGCDPLTIPVAVMMADLQLQPYYDFVTEINKNRLVDHQNILAVREELNDGGRLWLTFEFIGPSLRVLYPKGAPLQVIANCIFNVVEALVIIHGKKLIHGEVNAGNIFVQPQAPYMCKLGFGATVYECLPEEEPLQHFLLPARISYWGDAPEVFSKGQIKYSTSSSDIWQLGVTALELAGGIIWVKGRNDFDDIVHRATKEWECGVFGNVDFKNFLIACLNDNSEMRPTSEMLLHHAFFRNK